MAEHNETGRIGEDIAMEHLQKEGYKILSTNWKAGKLEIDIIAQDKDVLVIVEVKTRMSEEYEEPEDAVTMKKQKHLIKAANEYVYQRNITSEVRFDIISIIMSNDPPMIEHIVDAFYPIL